MGATLTNINHICDEIAGRKMNSGHGFLLFWSKTVIHPTTVQIAEE
jgi:hypothetical protein